MDHQEKVQSFFELHSENYKKKYCIDNPIFHYFFFERLEEATHGINHEDKTILDIGAGTGGLYDYLVNSKKSFRSYYATDIASGMLTKSQIPQENRFVGNCYEIQLPQKHFDIIYMLGVSTYMRREELERNLSFIAASMRVDSLAIISFTNARSLDNFSKKLFTRPIRWIGGEERLAAQGLDKFFYSYQQAQSVCEKYFKVNRTAWLNHTFFPFSWMFKKLSVNFAYWIKKNIRNKEWLSSDFLLFLYKE